MRFMFDNLTRAGGMLFQLVGGIQQQLDGGYVRQGVCKSVDHARWRGKITSRTTDYRV